MFSPGGRRSVAAANSITSPLHNDYDLAVHGIMEARQPHRKRPARFPLTETYNRSTITLITVCTDKRRPLLNRTEVITLLVDAWRHAATWMVGRYTILPDHLHLFCSPASDETPALTDWAKFWKSYVSQRWPWPNEQPIWQQNFWDRQLRSSEHYGQRWEYVRNNPVRQGLVANADDWPLQGEINVFRFHDGS